MATTFCDLFIESPYVAALAPNYLRSYCSNCFAFAKRGCGKCKVAHYCTKECQTQDWPYHKAECNAFARQQIGQCSQKKHKIESLKKPKMDDDEIIRVAGRILLRLRKDSGEASLAENFPTFLKNRTFLDLMSHVEDFDKDFLNGIVEKFREFFHGQRGVGDVGDSELRMILGRIMINSFCISSAPNENGVFLPLGTAVYLNASRFNHTCERDAKITADFDGAKIALKFVMNGSGENCVPDTEEIFNQLTLCYGFQGYPWTAVPWLQQRRSSLIAGYFFECHCPRCIDDLEGVYSWDASTRECPNCQKPYVLDGRHPGRLLSICSCRVDQNETRALHEFENNSTVMADCGRLEKEWNSAMEICIGSKSPLEVVRVGEPFRVLASKYWHPIYNLRYAQINEILFAAYRALALSHFTDHPLFANEIAPTISYRFEIPSEPTSSNTGMECQGSHDIQLALQVGEAVYNAYQHYLPDYDYHFVYVAVYLGELFELAAMLWPTYVVYKGRAIRYYSDALDTWRSRQWKNSDAYTNQILYRLERARGSDVVVIDCTADMNETVGNFSDRGDDHQSTDTKPKDQNTKPVNGMTTHEGVKDVEKGEGTGDKRVKEKVD